eukprot:s922_g30.t1
MQTGCHTWEEWRTTVDVVNATVNRLSNKSGFSPAQRMLGFNPRLPGALLSGGQEDHGSASRYVVGDQQVQRSMEIRKQAALAFHEADCSQALRHAVRSGPKKIYDYEPGQTVYFWRKGMDRAKKDSPAYWHGPARVVLTNLPSTVWVSHHGYLVKACPEHLRPVSDDEKFILTDYIADIVDSKKAIENDKVRGFVILDERPPEEPEPPAGEVPKFRLTGKTKYEDVIFDQPEAKRLRANPEPAGEGVPPDRASEGYSPTEFGNEEPEMPDENQKTDEKETEPTQPAVERVRGHEGMAPKEEEETAGEGVSSSHGTVRAHEEEGNDEESRPSKRLRTELLEIYFTQIENLVTRKRKEVHLNKMTKLEKERFQKAIQKEIKTNLQSGAYEFLSKEESEKIRRTKPEKVMKSRYVLTEKPIDPEDIAKVTQEGLLLPDQSDGPCKAKARHVMKGFSETGAEFLDSTTPQVAKETAFFVLQVLASMRWLIGHLDFTQAFHSGDRIQRELYAEVPPEGVPGASDRQLLRLLKTCYGLTDGPYAWYQHISRILLELGYEKSRADPCLFFLRGHGGKEVNGIIGLATDDMIHGGDKNHWTRMDWLKKNYQMGKYTTGNGKFTGKNIVQNKNGSISIHQGHYIKQLQRIEISRTRASEKFAQCTEEEIAALRCLIGGLSWVAKESRPDIAGRVALLQQSMPHPFVKDMIEGNSILTDLQKDPELGIVIQPIPLEKLRVGVATDASWGNAGPNVEQGDGEDYWEETETYWIRHHRLRRTLTFHPGSVTGGPDLHKITRQRTTILNDEVIHDEWNQAARKLQGQSWTGRTIFYKAKKTEKGKIDEKFLQSIKMHSQGGYILFYYDKDLEVLEKPEMISVAGWKSYKLKRCTVNTLSAECQAMLQGVGGLHWHRFLLAEVFGIHLELGKWEQQLSRFPFIAVTDSKSLYDTVTKCRNSSAHVDDKRTAIDLTILKSDLANSQGQVRWVGGGNMISDALTKKMNPKFLQLIMKVGRWALTESGHQALVGQQPT